MQYLAHISFSGKQQTLKQHLKEVAKYASDSAKTLHLEHTAYLCGLLHDAGKYTDAYQEYLKKAAKKDPTAYPGLVDHAYAGAKLITDIPLGDSKNQVCKEIIANVIMSHHRGRLTDMYDRQRYPFNERMQNEHPDFKQIMPVFRHDFPDVDLEKLLKKATEEVFKEITREIQNRIVKSIEKNDYPNIVHSTIMWLTKYLFSCLLNADHVTTGNFERNLDNSCKLPNAQLRQWNNEVATYFKSLDKNTPINKVRNQIRQEVMGTFSKRDEKTGLYTLTIPTGGGKTLMGLQLALKSVTEQKQNTIFYFAPYISIVEQNASVFKSILSNNDQILEQHSNIKIDNETNYRYDTSTWRDPLIATTSHSFLATVFGRGSAENQRFYQLLNSTLIIDEPQSIPVKSIGLLTDFFQWIQSTEKTTVILSTATQPALATLQKPYQICFDAELAKNYQEFETQLIRVNIIDRTKKIMRLLDVVDLVKAKLTDIQINSIVVTVNTTDAAQQILMKLREADLNETTLYHLSTRMCAQHRLDVLTQMKQKLKEHESVILVSTPVIEAGVDCDFDCVIRSLSGLDNIAQIAGRCNRNGLRSSESSEVIIIKIDAELEHLNQLPDIRLRQSLTDTWLHDTETKNDLLKSGEQQRYFKALYQSAISNHILEYPVSDQQPTLYQQLHENIEPHDKQWPYELNWQSIADNYRIIDDQATAIVVPYNKTGKKLISNLLNANNESDTNKLFKSAQRYIVNVTKYVAETLLQSALIQPVLEGTLFVATEQIYDMRVGLTL